MLYVLMTAAYGMQLWVPVDKLEQWKAAQEDKSPERKERRKALCSRILEAMDKLKAQGK